MPVFDAKTMLSQFGGDRELARAIIESAMEDIPNYFDILEKAMSTANWADAKRFTHTLKGLAAQLGGMQLTGRCKEADERLKGGGCIDSTTLTELRKEYRLLTDALRAWMQAPA